jgi:RNA polymerase sigma-70 factor (ECF subfamily)
MARSVALDSGQFPATIEAAAPMNHALEHIWNELAEKLRRFIGRRVANDAAAEDILQDVCLKLAKRADELPEPAKLRGWVFLITRNAIIDHYRTRKETVAVPETLVDETSASPEEVDGLNASLRRMVRSLPEPYREAVRLTGIKGLPQVELAKRLGISVSGAKSRVQRGRQMLKEMLLDCCQFEFDRRGGINECTPRGIDCPECEPAKANDSASRPSSRVRGASHSRREMV